MVKAKDILSFWFGVEVTKKQDGVFLEPINFIQKPKVKNIRGARK